MQSETLLSVFFFSHLYCSLSLPSFALSLSCLSLPLSRGGHCSESLDLQAEGTYGSGFQTSTVHVAAPTPCWARSRGTLGNLSISQSIQTDPRKSKHFQALNTGMCVVLCRACSRPACLLTKHAVVVLTRVVCPPAFCHSSPVSSSCKEEMCFAVAKGSCCAAGCGLQCGLLCPRCSHALCSHSLAARADVSSACCTYFLQNNILFLNEVCFLLSTGGFYLIVF